MKDGTWPDGALGVKGKGHGAKTEGGWGLGVGSLHHSEAREARQRLLLCHLRGVKGPSITSCLPPLHYGRWLCSSTVATMNTD